MYKARILLALGTWMAILPYLGFPYSWKDILTTVTGLVVIYISYLLYKDNKIKEKTFDNFSENDNFSEEKNSAEVSGTDVARQEASGRPIPESSSEFAFQE